ncbi:MAG: substrate-binding domain-containing protein [Proteobacteria bacterium]|nr:substrate-binding domain-containing protein [Pseudomonadota bacterium]
MRPLRLLLLLAVAVAAPAATRADAPFLVLASTTSTENSGLFAAILPRFRDKTGIAVRVVAVGTGQAIRMAMRGDADVLLVHDRASEERFVAEGYGIERFDLMWNDFAIVGPRSDPAAVAGGADAAAALTAIASRGAPFLSRGDDSGTHKAELRLWAAAGIDPVTVSVSTSGSWYRETGSGMGATLNTAAALGAYTLADRGTWLSFRNRRDLVVQVEGDPRLRNPYGVIAVDPERHPHVKAREADALVQWLLSAEGQAAIGAFRIDGRVLFHPAAQEDADSSR